MLGHLPRNLCRWHLLLTKFFATILPTTLGTANNPYLAIPTLQFPPRNSHNLIPRRNLFLTQFPRPIPQTVARGAPACIGALSQKSLLLSPSEKNSSHNLK